ncbi:thiamine pyrophosphate-dependent dehydrogenase E1 component subunit alpha [Sphingomonas profundi]|uniref:thiamine pyrophosphate-dependent dehydrogenase E1 component subunit alpha n=1 Tax=Alterirhizorhabdus profundi TaxID=2681549 RepID=UPI0012E7B4FF|nr:thiamine pyrophosphate-dependent dehydrogenase E1 component subunit alpha [Sphingomonas profundi]
MQLSRDDLVKAYRLMRTIRAFEERVFVEFESGNIPGFVHLYSGQEASAVGVCMSLTDADKIGSTHRGHGHCIAKGVEVRGMMHEIYGRRDGVCGGKGGSMHIADFDKGMIGANAIVGGAPPLAVGAALAAKTKGEDSVAVSFTGDGGSNQGTVFEAMNLAVVLQLPVLFVFENNGFGEGTGHDYAVGSRDIAKRAEGFGMPATRVDGTDFFAVYEATREAVTRARAGGGPSAIETVNRRFGGHFCGDPMLYRTAEEREHTRLNKDPLTIFRRRVTEAGLLDGDQLDAVDAAVLAEVDEAARSAGAADFPTARDLETDVYAGAY